jgi:hypothetical protein
MNPHAHSHRREPSRALAVVLFCMLAACSRVPPVEGPLKLEMAVPHVGTQPGVLNWEMAEFGKGLAGSPNGHFHVILWNASKKELRIFQEWCSWGYSALSFELIDEHGAKWQGQKRGLVWTNNGPKFWTLNANERVVFDVYFSDFDMLEDRMLVGRRHPTGRCALIATYDLQPDTRSKELGIWTGHLVSVPINCVIR